MTFLNVILTFKLPLTLPQLSKRHIFFRCVSTKTVSVNKMTPVIMLLCYVMLCGIFFTVGSLQFCSDSTIASLEANQNRPKIQYYGNK